MSRHYGTCATPVCENLIWSRAGQRRYCAQACKTAYAAGRRPFCGICGEPKERRTGPSLCSTCRAQRTQLAHRRKHHSCGECGAPRDNKRGPALCSKCRSSCKICGGPRTLHFRLCVGCKPEYDRKVYERNLELQRKRKASRSRCRGCGDLGAFRGTCETCRPLCASCWKEPKHQGSSYCRGCKNDQMKRRFRVASGIPEDAESRTSCLECENPLEPAGVHTSVAVTMRFCSQTCRYRYKNRQRRARRLNVRYVEYSRADILERDGWKCQICTKPISRRLKFPHPMSPSIDHIIPLTKGGTDEPRNVQAAHWKCNVDKGNRAANDQLRLVG